MSWTLHDNRSYRRETPQYQAFVFGASRPTQMWAWAVWWKSGRAGGVEQGFRAAKTQAEQTIRQIEERMPV